MDVGDGRGEHVPVPPKKEIGKYLSGNYHVKFGNFVNFSGKYHVKFEHFVNFLYIIFGQKCLALPKLTELLRL